jgi:hypothetical protein
MNSERQARTPEHHVVVDRPSPVDIEPICGNTHDAVIANPARLAAPKV